MTRKIPFPLDKRQWQLNPIPAPITLVSTVDVNGLANFAPVSWVQMAAFQPPILMFSCSKDGRTGVNAIATKCFAVNCVDTSLVEKVFSCTQWHGRERLERSGFRLGPASVIAAPLVEDCRIHLECRLVDTKEIGSGFIVFGEIVAASIAEELLQFEPQECYAGFDPALYLDDRFIGTLGLLHPVPK